MPRQLIAPGREQVAFAEYQLPELKEGQVRVKTLYGAAKHGTEMALYKGYAGPRGGYDAEYRIFTRELDTVRYPATLGNMGVGEVVETGPGVTRLKKGDVVFNYGPFREEHVWPETARRLPEGVPWQAAVCLDPADFALGAVRDGHVRLGDAVAVFGMGAIGLMAVQLARLAGAHPVIAVEPLELRRQVAAECGADLVLDPADCDAGLEIKKATDKRGADVCIEYSGHHLALQAALRGAAYGARSWPGPGPERTRPAWTWGPKPTSTDPGSYSRAPAANPIPTTPTGTRTGSSTWPGACWPTAASGANPWSGPWSVSTTS